MKYHKSYNLHLLPLSYCITSKLSTVKSEHLYRNNFMNSLQKFLERSSAFPQLFFAGGFVLLSPPLKNIPKGSGFQDGFAADNQANSSFAFLSSAETRLILQVCFG